MGFIHPDGVCRYRIDKGFVKNQKVDFGGVHLLLGSRLCVC